MQVHHQSMRGRWQVLMISSPSVRRAEFQSPQNRRYLCFLRSPKLPQKKATSSLQGNSSWITPTETSAIGRGYHLQGVIAGSSVFDVNLGRSLSELDEAESSSWIVTAYAVWPVSQLFERRMSWGSAAHYGTDCSQKGKFQSNKSWVQMKGMSMLRFCYYLHLLLVGKQPTESTTSHWILLAVTQESQVVFVDSGIDLEGLEVTGKRVVGFG